MAGVIKTLPASWFCSKPLYELEQRAVFSKCWYLLGTVNKFTGEDIIHYEFAGVELAVSKLEGGLVVIRQSDVKRLYDSVEIDGKTLKLTNNPYQGHILSHKVTTSGLLFSTISEDAPSFEEFYPGLENLLNTVDFTRLPHRRTISYEGRFNWKTMVDGYQECLHCQYTHKSFAVLYPPTSYAVHNHGNYSRHIADPEKPDDGLFLYFFPNCTLNVYGGGMSSFRVCPTSDPGVSRMEFDYYHEQEGETFEEYFRFVRRVALEDYELCEKAQGNLERGIYCQGVLNPIKETGVRHYQQRVREMVVRKFNEEKATGVITC